MNQASMSTLGVLIKVADIERSRRFYETLGFVKDFDYGLGTETSETYHGTFYRIGESAVIEIVDAHEAVKPEVFQEQVGSSKVSIFVKVDSLVPILRAAREHNIPRAVEPRRFHWHAIEIVIIDPDGLRVVFVSPDSDEEIERVKQLTTADLDRQEPNYAPLPDSRQ